EAETGARHAASGRCAVEAVEDVREIVLVESGAAVANGQRSVAKHDIDDGPGRAPLARVVQHVGHRAADPLALATHERRLDICLKRDRRAGATLVSLNLRDDDLVDADIVDEFDLLGAAGELDDVADERGQLVELADDVGTQALALRLREALCILEDLDVRA